MKEVIDVINIKNKSAFVISVLVVMLFLSGCGQQSNTANTPAANNAAPPAANAPATDASAKAAAPTEKVAAACGGDQSCLHSNFLACNPAEFKMPFIQGSEYSISIIGMENGNCHYKTSVTGLPTSECAVPKELITEDRFGHFFGSEKVPGKEIIAAEQQKIDADYCKQI